MAVSLHQQDDGVCHGKSGDQEEPVGSVAHFCRQLRPMSEECLFFGRTLLLVSAGVLWCNFRPLSTLIRRIAHEHTRVEKAQVERQAAGPNRVRLAMHPFYISSELTS